ncbi:MAG TPA: glucose 1-dehydrogenase [Acidimicrobiales bacterium]|nr:glucose 1-dehydrogenase [Acidimicrobiales bacterium]
MGRLDGKVALISGAARGQGEAEARLFVAEGAKVVLGDVLDDLGEKLAVGIGDAAVYVHLDVTRQEDWEAAVETATSSFGRLDVLVNNAGILRFGSIERTPFEDYRRVIEINQFGCFLGMKAAIPALKAAGGGAIVNISSTQGLEGMAGACAYTASKFAVRGMTKSAALELGRFGIRVNSVHPGGIDTPMLQLDQVDQANKDAAYRHQPIGRIGQPEEVARLVAFLSSDEASYSTGSEFLVEGGMTAGLSIPGFE